MKDPITSTKESEERNAPKDKIVESSSFHLEGTGAVPVGSTIFNTSMIRTIRNIFHPQQRNPFMEVTAMS